MGPQLPSAPPALWVLAGSMLLLGVWVLCTACHRKRVSRPQAGLQGAEMLANSSLLRQTHLCSLSKSDTRLHELHRGPQGSRAPRPASMDLLRPHWLEGYRGTLRLPEVPPPSPHQEPPWPLPVVPAPAPSGLETTYSNVGLAALPRASLAASPEVWSGAQLHSGWAMPGLGPVLAEYACVRKLKGTDECPQEHHRKTELSPVTQVDSLYSRVNKPKKRDAGSTTEQLDSKGTGSSQAHLQRSPGLDHDPQENVYESIQELSHEPRSLPTGC
ncbi:PREDICTED: lck-interacting transmembrane adapter 1 [Chrysochloris asiatica]|uniref:Lck-interacting transmembrane adapter 1 n=1 Tax=Chrysochloris asiatica TaxID=185453 RepID=A0A9B0TXX8_CHRAS|nr:PREDICTED: lck-interacting transmembrane adapter 1 [Chrysochloris asiatica]